MRKLFLLFLLCGAGAEAQSLAERIKDLTKTIEAAQKSLLDFQDTRSTADGRENYRDSLRMRIGQLRFQIYELAYEAKLPGDHLALAVTRGAYDKLVDMVATDRVIPPGRRGWHFPLAPLFSVNPRPGNTAAEKNLRYFGLNGLPDQELADVKNLGRIVSGWITEKNLGQVSKARYPIRDPTKYYRSIRRPITNSQIPEEVIDDIKTFEQFQVLRTFVEERIRGKNVADWDWFHILIEETTTPERARLAVGMITSRERGWDTRRTVEMVRKLPPAPDVSPQVPRTAISDLFTLNEFNSRANERLRPLADFLGEYYGEIRLPCRVYLRGKRPVGRPRKGYGGTGEGQLGLPLE